MMRPFPRPTFALRRLALLLAGAILAPAAPGHAQRAHPSLRSHLPAPPAAVTRADGPVPVPVPALVAVGVAAGATGLAAGAYIGWRIEALGECSDWCGLGGAVLGGAVGESLGVPLGVHLANGMRGSLAASSLASLGIAAGGLLILSTPFLAHTAVLWSIPVAQLVSSIAIERRTARERRAAPPPAAAAPAPYRPRPGGIP